MARTGTATPGRIGERQIALGRHRLGGGDFELAGLGAGVKGEGFFIGEGGAVVDAAMRILSV